MRYGVAPDHPDTKVVTKDFTDTARQCQFLGNVEVGVDVSVAQLRQCYSAVVFAYGASNDRALEIPGRDLSGVFSARQFVNWYNGHPEYADLDVDLSKSDTAVVIGQGNVAVDVARVLLSPLDRLASTDICSHALDRLSRSAIQHVHLVGRRGPVQAACTTKELRELTRLPGCTTLSLSEEFAAGMTAASEREAGVRAAKRKMQVLRSTVMDSPPDSGATLSLRFLLSPTRYTGSGALDGVVLNRTELSGPEGSQQARVTDEQLRIDTGLVFESIGYRATGLPGLAFDAARSVVPSAAGRTEAPGVYTAGWLKRGPTGIIGTNIADAVETVESLVEDVRAGVLAPAAGPPLKEVLAPGARVVDFAGWEKIDAEEIRRGTAKGKPREKIVSVAEMLEVAGV